MEDPQSKASPRDCDKLDHQKEHDAIEVAAAAALRAGDRRRALAELMKGYGNAIYRYCRQVLGERALADDVHQTVFVQAFQDFDDYAGRSTLRTWLYSIARHRCLDALKSNRRWWNRFVTDDTSVNTAQESTPAEDTLANAAAAQQLERCLQLLKPEIRMAVLLRHQEGLSYEDIARISRERASTLQARVARAMPVLRRCLEQHGVVL